MNTTSRLFWGSLILAGTIQAKDFRVLEVTSDTLKVPATVEFLATKTSGVALKAQPTANKSFDWVDIPEGATAARIKVGELATRTFDLATSGTNLVVLGQPTVDQDANGAPKAVLASTVTERPVAPDGSAGWIFFGNLKTGGAGDAGWNSLYLVLPSKKALNADVGDTLSAVKSLAMGRPLRVDFPLILREMDAQNNLVRTANDKTIRAGQYVRILEIKEPDAKGDVYARVEVGSRSE
jgi:hypothetical protein